MLHFIFARQRQVLSALSQIAKHSVDLAEMVVEAEIFPVVLTCLKDKDEYVKKNACTLIREIAKHTPEVKQAKQKRGLHGTVTLGVKFLNKTPICFICSEACSTPSD